MECAFAIDYPNIEDVFFLRELMRVLEKEVPRCRLGCQTNGWTSPKKDYDHRAILNVQKFLFGKMARTCWTFSTWFNILSQGGEMHEHDHHQARFSAVMHLSHGSHLAFPSLGQAFDPYPGCIVVFPGSLVHCVRLHEGEEDRLSMAMNIDLKRQV